jgi:polyribonucleotide nucleotidyltransferase
VAKEWSEHWRRYVGELHDAGDDDGRQRIDVPRGGKQHGGDGDERGGDADGERGGGGADDHDAANKPDGDNGTDGDVCGGGCRDRAIELPVAEERSEHCGGHVGELHDVGDDDGGQWLDVPRGGKQHGGDGDERGGDADSESNADPRHPGKFQLHQFWERRCWE